jgi:flavorubredoxin
MKNIFRAVKVSDHVYWVGAIDWAIREFHGYTTRRGSTYNAYLVLANKITLIDTVKAPFREELLSRIASIVDPKEIQYIISNHSEMDHSGCLPQVIDFINPEKIYTSVMGAKALEDHFHMSRDIIPLKDGDSVSLGNLSLSFLETRMLHWPDSMFSYLQEEKILFSQDAFGMHLASSGRFDDDIDPDILDFEASTYYANIILPYSPLVVKLLDRVEKMGIGFNIIAPDHGPIWRKNVTGIIGKYKHWASRKQDLKAVVVYATMWHSTEMMARAISEGLAAGGVTVKLMSMDQSHRSDVAYEILDAGAVVVGSSTLNNHILPNMADILTYLKGLRPTNLIGAAFGSYGWSGEAIGELEQFLKDIKADRIGETIKARYVPDSDNLMKCYALGGLIASKLRDKIVAQ